MPTFATNQTAERDRSSEPPRNRSPQPFRNSRAHVKSALLGILLLACPLVAVAEDSPPWKAAITIERIDHPDQIEGHWSLASEWEGFMGLALELRDGRFRYWFTSDTGGAEPRPVYPFTGKFTVEHGFLVLETEHAVYDKRWLLITHKGRAGLFPFSGFEIITMRRESPHTRMLFRLSDRDARTKWPRYNAPK